MERQANRWGNPDDGDSEAGTPYKRNNFSNRDDSDDETTSSQEEQQQKKEKYYGLEISHRLLCDASPLLAHIVIHALQSHAIDPVQKTPGENVWEAFNRAALDAQTKLYARERQMAVELNFGGNDAENAQVMADFAREFTIKHNVNVRLVDLCGGLRKPNVSSIRSYDVGSFVEIGGKYFKATQ